MLSTLLTFVFSVIGLCHAKLLLQCPAVVYVFLDMNLKYWQYPNWINLLAYFGHLPAEEDVGSGGALVGCSFVHNTSEMKQFVSCSFISIGKFGRIGNI